MGQKFSPKDFFLWLGAMIALYVSVGSFITLIFDCVNVLLPDAIELGYDPYSAAMRFAIASLIIVFPLYLFLTRVLNRDLRANPDKREYGVRKWLIFITLFVAGISIIVDLIVLVNFFLNGEITMRFVLKVLTVLVTSGAVFGYYLADLRGRWEREVRQSILIGYSTGIVVLVAVIAAFFIIGSPMTARQLRLDEQKVSDLQNIQWQIVGYWQAKETLPETLADVEDPINGFIAPIDRQSGKQYTYHKTGQMSFDLCATFNRTSESSHFSVPKYETSDTWDHPAGEYCFVRTIDPERYPPTNKTNGNQTVPGRTLVPSAAEPVPASGAN